MSRFLSHREAKAVQKVLPEIDARMALLEGVIKALLDERGQTVAVALDGTVKLIDKRAAEIPEVEGYRELPEEGL